MSKFEIFFDELKEETQKELLKFYGLKKADERNFKYVPICILGE